MKHLYAIAAICAVALIAGSTPTTAANWKNCGDQKRTGAGFYDVHAKNIGCKRAKGVARKWTWGGGWQVGRFWGFNCKDRRVGYEVRKVRCTRVLGSGLHQDVKFEAGA